MAENGDVESFCLAGFELLLDCEVDSRCKVNF
jgi:hypothetical protein